MEQKTKVIAEDNKQDLLITRLFNLPIDLVFKAYVEPNIVEQWMGTKVIKLENKNHGSYQFITTGPNGESIGFNGTIHELNLNKNITRTFEMENSPFGVQLEFLEFIPSSANKCQLNMQVIYKSVSHRDKLLQMPFAKGINMAHNRLEEILGKK